MASKQKVKQRSLHAVETILGPDYSRKLLFYSKEQLFYCYKEVRSKTLRKEKSNRRLLLLGSIGRIPEK